MPPSYVTADSFLPDELQDREVLRETRAHALISWVDRACGHSARLTEDFTQPLIKAAVEVTRNFQGREIEEAMNYLFKGRDNPAVVKRTDFVLAHFAEYVRGT